MEQRMIDNIKEQIDFLKSDLNCVYPDSELGAKKMVEAREATKLRILQLMDRLAGIEPPMEDKQYYRQLLEKIVNDRSALDAAREAVEEMDDDDNKQQTIDHAVEVYEDTKRSIADKILARLD